MNSNEQLIIFAYTSKQLLNIMRKLTAVLLAAALMLGVSCSVNQSQKNIPLPEHPRPDFERTEWMNLNGYWSFTFEKAAADKALQANDLSAMNQKIMVPFPWGSKLSEVEDNGDIAWYARKVSIPAEWKGKRVFLVVGGTPRCGATDRKSDVTRGDTHPSNAR